MSKAVKMTKDEAESFRKGGGKAVAKKKVKRASEEPPKQQVELRSTSDPSDSKVKSGGVRGVITDTLTRVYAEQFPNTDFETEYWQLQLSEEAYIVTLGMVFGWSSQVPRRGVKMREHNYGEIPYCKEHQ